MYALPFEEVPLQLPSLRMPPICFTLKKKKRTEESHKWWGWMDLEWFCIRGYKYECSRRSFHFYKSTPSACGPSFFLVGNNTKPVSHQFSDFYMDGYSAVQLCIQKWWNRYFLIKIWLNCNIDHTFTIFW